LQEIFDLCHEDFVGDVVSAEEQLTDEAGQRNMLLSAAASSGQSSSRTLQFSGTLGGIAVRILVDSGSSHSFLSSSVATQLPGVSPVPKPVSVTVANGGSMQCTAELVSAEWSVQGYSFHSNLKILPLTSFDMIVGMDWLEAFSPMKIHWLQRWISFPYGRSTVVLHGLSPSTQDCQLLQLLLVAPESSDAQFEEVYLLYSRFYNSSSICLPSPLRFHLGGIVITRFLLCREQVLYRSDNIDIPQH
jgi:hypothetical protein